MTAVFLPIKILLHLPHVLCLTVSWKKQFYSQQQIIQCRLLSHERRDIQSLVPYTLKIYNQSAIYSISVQEIVPMNCFQLWHVLAANIVHNIPSLTYKHFNPPILVIVKSKEAHFVVLTLFMTPALHDYTQQYDCSLIIYL